MRIDMQEMSFIPEKMPFVGIDGPFIWRVIS